MFLFRLPASAGFPFSPMSQCVLVYSILRVHVYDLCAGDGEDDETEMIDDLRSRIDEYITDTESKR